MHALVSQLQKLDIETSTLQPVHLATGEIFFTLSVPRRQAYPVWYTLRKQMTMTAHWPLILGTDEEATFYQQDVTDPDLPSVTQIISNAHGFNRHTWLSNRLRELGYAPRHEDPDPDRQSIDEAPGPWLEEVTPKWHSWYELSIFPRRTRGGTPVIVALFPTTKCWEIPAWLKYGNWNACPEPEGHVLLWHHWHQQFDAEPVALAADTLEFRVQRPPTNKPAALELAYEHFTYCPDRAEEDVKLIASLAALLLNSNRWFFWWD